jgi:NAD+ diphosphatase
MWMLMALDPRLGVVSLIEDPSRFPHVAPIALSMHAHNRIATRRTDEEWLAHAWADPGTRVLLLHDAQLVLSGDDWWFRPEDAAPGQRVLLGDDGGSARFVVLVDELPAGARTVTLRSVLATLSDDDAGLVVHAVAMAEWHAGHRYCPRCGTALQVSAAGHLLHCPGCGRQQFPRTDPAVIMVVTDGDDRCLLGRQARWPEGRYSTLAGFVEPGESLEQAVAREVAEEVGVEVGEVSYFGNQPWPFPASLMVGFFAHARTTRISVDGAEISDARWFSREQMKDEAEAGTLLLPGGVSISRSLVETWYGGPLPGSW